MSSYSEYVEERAAEKAREERDREMIGKKLLKGRSPEWIHEEDEYPMELILEVQAELKAEYDMVDLGEESMPIQNKLERMDLLSYGDEREKRGEDKFARLVSKLIQDGRYEDLEKAANDRQYRAELLETGGEQPGEVENDVDDFCPDREIDWGPDVGGEVIQ